VAGQLRAQRLNPCAAQAELAAAAARRQAVELRHARLRLNTALRWRRRRVLGRAWACWQLRARLLAQARQAEAEARRRALAAAALLRRRRAQQLRVSPLLAWIGSLCLRRCVHGASILIGVGTSPGWLLRPPSSREWRWRGSRRGSTAGGSAEDGRAFRHGPRCGKTAAELPASKPTNTPRSADKHARMSGERAADDDDDDAGGGWAEPGVSGSDVHDCLALALAPPPAQQSPGDDDDDDGAVAAEQQRQRQRQQQQQEEEEEEEPALSPEDEALLRAATAQAEALACALTTAAVVIPTGQQFLARRRQVLGRLTSPASPAAPASPAGPGRCVCRHRPAPAISAGIDELSLCTAHRPLPPTGVECVKQVK
jgi:hypothetical protein